VLPRIDDILTQMDGAAYFFVMDLASGSCGSGAREDSICTTMGGLYEITRAPFGLSRLPGQFSRSMASVLHKALGVYAAVFLYDVVVYSNFF
jgi:hypothetical protein